MPCSAGSSRPRRDELRIDARPEDGASARPLRDAAAGFGRPALRTTVLSAIDPIEARCDCPDFVKNSLGVCKHVLIVLEHLYARPRLLQQARKEQEFGSAAESRRAALGPDPAVDRAGDWLERVAWVRRPEANGVERRSAGRGPEVVPSRRRTAPSS